MKLRLHPNSKRTAPATGETLHLGPVSFEAQTDKQGTSRLVDPKRGNSVVIDSRKLAFRSKTMAFSNENATWAGSAPAAVESYYALQAVWDVLQSLGRDSLDGKGRPLRVFLDR